MTKLPPKAAATRPPPLARVTIRDVAKAAKVSLTTVSDVVNGKGRVDPETRTRVMQTVTELGYRPQRAARALRSGRTGTVALCIARPQGQTRSVLMNTDYDMALALACAAAAMDSEQLLLLSPKPADLSELSRLDVDGIIVVDPPQGDATLRVADQANMPVVTVDRDLDRSDGWWVGADNKRTATTLLAHLAERGARSVALLAYDAPFAWFADMREAYLAWCAERSTAPIIRNLDMTNAQASAAEVVGTMIDDGTLPDAVLALPYNSALGVAAEARSRGISIPDELRIAAGVDGHALETTQPPITSIDLRPADVGRAAVELLTRRIAGNPDTGPVFVEAELRPRASS